MVFNGTSDFSLPRSTAATFIFVTEDGTIAGWNGGSTATIVVDNSKNNALYKGCTIAELNDKHYLYVANFHSGEIEVYDSSFHRVQFSHALLVGMFGSGQIAAFNPVDGEFLGLMKAPNDKTLAIDGLWALGFGAGNPNSGPYNTLFFTAGPNDESDGLFGTLIPISTELNEADEPYRNNQTHNLP